jgi:H3 lysine-79-specific histone-lysine N-methyltransferase
LSSSDDDDDTDDTSLNLRVTKRVKVSASAEPDFQRRLRSESTLAEESFDMIHAADITGGGKKTVEFTPAFGLDGEPVVVSLQYPGASYRERYVFSVLGHTCNFSSR